MLMDEIKIIIVDDHVLFSQSLTYLIESFEEFSVIGNYSNGKEFIAGFSIASESPDIILLDVNMPIMNGIETMKWIRLHFPDLRVIALSVNDDEETIMKMVTNGACGYLLKDMHPKTFREALIEVYHKGVYYTEMVSGMLISKVVPQELNTMLKKREMEFLELACTEKTYREIADLMCLSHKTVDGYREELFHRFGIKTRIGLVLYAIKNKIVDV